MSRQQLEPIEAARAKAKTLESTLDSVRTKASLSQVFDAIEDMDSDLGAIGGRLSQVRTRGYVFKSHLEADLQAVHNEWPATRLGVQMDAEAQRRRLVPQMDELQVRYAEARALIETDLIQGEAVLAAVEAAGQALQKNADSAISTLQGMYDSLKSRLDKVKSSVDKVERILVDVDKASFKLYPDENIVDTIEGQWLTDQKGGPKGILYCTDHRLLFEQKEEVATKRMLFVVTEKQKVQQLVLDVPIGAVQQAKESESGALLFRRDHLELAFGPQSKVRSAHFILKGDSAAWQQLINRVNAGEIEKEWVKRAEPAAADAPKAMPTQCPTCGARITQTLVRGMKSVKCQYCGSVIPL